MSPTKRFSLLVLPLATALLAACASKPTIRSNVDPAADFSHYKTFAFFDEATGRAPAYDSFATRYIKVAIDREMRSRGYDKSSQPQLLVNIHVQTQDKVKVMESPTGYYGYRSGLYGWGTGVTTTVDNYTEGTLNVDIVDSAAGRLVWEGIAIGRIRDKSYDDPQPAIDAVVKQIFEAFPKQPPNQL
jgi:hypothetical protein